MAKIFLFKFFFNCLWNMEYKYHWNHALDKIEWFLETYGAKN